MSVFSGSGIRKRAQQPWRRVVFLRQLATQEGGAACLAMVLNHFRMRVSVDQISRACAIAHDGTRAATLAAVARQFGLKPLAYAVDIGQLDKLPLPAILHWRFNHFVVLESVSKNGVIVLDPAKGRRRAGTQQLTECFTGMALTFEPPTEVKPPQEPGLSASMVGYLRRMFAQPGVRWVVFKSLGSAAAIQLLGLAAPLFTALIIDHILPLRSLDLLRITGLGLLFSIGTLTALTYIRGLSLIYLRGRADTALMSEFVRHLFSLPFSFFQQRSTGDLLLSLRSNSILREVLTNQTLSVLPDGLFLVVNLAILLWLLPVYAWLVLALAALQVLVLLISNRRIFYLSQRELSAAANEQAYIVEAINGIAILKASGAEERAIDRWATLFTDQFHASLQRARATAGADAALTWFRSISPLVLLWVGTSYVLSGRVSLGQFMAMQSVATAFLMPLATMVSTTQQLQLAPAYLQRLADVLDARPEQSGALRAGRLSGRIELRNLSFRYHPDGPWVLRNVSLTIQPGRKVAIIGPTGSGKSTLAMLLLGMYVPTEGEILYDGMPLSREEYGGMRRQFGVTLQHPFCSAVRFGRISASLGQGSPRKRLWKKRSSRKSMTRLSGCPWATKRSFRKAP